MAKIIICAECGRAREHHAKTLCRQCYDHDYYERHSQRIIERTRRYYESAKDKWRVYASNFRKRNPDYRQRWRQENPEKVAAQQARRRARRRQLPDTLTGEQAELKLSTLPCLYCGGNADLTLDHFVPLAAENNLACGTTLANTVVACQGCNSRKYTKEPIEILRQLSLKEVNLDAL